VARYIETYCPKGGIVIDPFCGSGIVAFEALKLGRKAIAVDLNPISTELIRMTLMPVDIDALIACFKRIERDVKDEINEYYKTKCRGCSKEIVAQAFANDRKKGPIKLKD